MLVMLQLAHILLAKDVVAASSNLHETQEVSKGGT